MLTVAVARSSSDYSAIRYVLPVLWMTSCLPTIGKAKTTLAGHILKVTHKGAVLTTNSDKYARHKVVISKAVRVTDYRGHTPSNDRTSKENIEKKV